ncbi:uncharacterized protein LOC119675031 [Teleopsis dalmanni]|uniref:uncharacterized protein LOC119675031 n=1 Tax=Teleopsis dalmanni TaxID=139649 RepID=UPI0018CF1148|nr:uncharacterized protein LOC119675031 [Teleopsis dalmanni]
MLVATPAQSASYALSAATKKICHNNATATPKGSCGKNSNNGSSNNNINVLKTTPRAIVNKLIESSNNTNFIKTLSVRLNRGTELLKDAVQKTLKATSNVTNASASANPNLINNTTNNTTYSTQITTSTSSNRPVPSAAFLKKYTVPPTELHKHPKERLQTASVDSLHKELCHFIPIRAVPPTHWKSHTKSRGNGVIKPKMRKGIKIFLNLNCDDPLAESTKIKESSNAEATKIYIPKPSLVTFKTSLQSAFVSKMTRSKKITKPWPNRAKAIDTLRKTRNNNKAEQRTPTSSYAGTSRVNTRVKKILLESVNFVENMDDVLLVTKNTSQPTRKRAAKIIPPMAEKLFKQNRPNRKEVQTKTKARRRANIKDPISSLPTPRKRNKPKHVQVIGRTRSVKRKLVEATEVEQNENVEIRAPARKRQKRAADSNTVQQCYTGSKQKRKIAKNNSKAQLEKVRNTPPLTRARRRMMPEEKLWEFVDTPKKR